MSRDIRVLHLGSLYPPYVFGGAERVVALLAEGMARRGVVTAVAHLTPRRTAGSKQNGVEVHPLAHRNPLWIENSARYPAIVRHLNKVATLFNVATLRDFDTVLATFRPDVVHTHSMVELPPSMWDAAKAHGARVVHTLHDYDLLCIRATLFKDGRECRPRHGACAVFSAVKRRHHRHVDHVVGVSQSILETHLDHGFFRGLPATSRHVVWNPIRAAGRSSPDTAAPRDGPLVFGFLGRLVTEKGIELLLDACRGLPPSGWKLKIAGRAPGDSLSLRQRAIGLPVEFVGFVDPHSFLPQIDILVVPSTWEEPFGLTVVEAYAAGVPVLGSRAGGVAEVIGAIDPSWLVPRGDCEALRARMSGLIRAGRNDPAIPRNFSAVLNKTNAEYVVHRYLEIYTATLRQPNRQIEAEVSVAV